MSREQTGTQAESGSRRPRVATYISRIHRELHEAYAWGFLEQLDARAADHPLNDSDLWTRVEIVLNRDGTLDKVITVRASGKAAFDEAVREIVIAVAPFPEPPATMRSANGKSYLHWAFHRDARACGTFGADPFILEGVGSGDGTDPTPLAPSRESGLEPRHAVSLVSSARAHRTKADPKRRRACWDATCD